VKQSVIQDGQDSYVILKYVKAIVVIMAVVSMEPVIVIINGVEAAVKSLCVKMNVHLKVNVLLKVVYVKKDIEEKIVVLDM